MFQFSFVDFSTKKSLNPFVTKEHDPETRKRRSDPFQNQFIGVEHRANTKGSKHFADTFVRSTQIVEEHADDEPIVLNILDRSFENFSHFPPRPLIFRPASTALPRANFSLLASIENSMAQTTRNVANDVFRPTPIADVPELSKDNLLSMLNQIPDLKGRQFKIEYSSAGAQESYPLPFNLDSTTTSNYPEPVVIDKLPTNVIQHVKTSQNSALAAALDAAIAQEQNSSQPNRLNYSSGSNFHHTTENRGQVQESRPVSSDSSSESSSSDDESGSETETESESESEESELVALAPRT